MPMEAAEVREVVEKAIATHEKHEQALADRQRRELMEIVGAVRADLHLISAKLSEVADLRGEMKANRELTERLGRESKEHESRLRQIEVTAAVQGKSTSRFEGIVDKLIWLALAGGTGAVVGAKVLGS